jgi:hypothetical protein
MVHANGIAKVAKVMPSGMSAKVYSRDALLKRLAPALDHEAASRLDK